MAKQRMIRTGGIVALGLWLGAQTPLAAQASAPMGAQQATGGDTIVLTLDQAIEIALDNNPQVIQQRNNLRLNRLDSRQVWMQNVLPSINLSPFSTSYRGNLTRRAEDNFGNPISNPQADWVYFSSASQGLSLNWTLRGEILNQVDQNRLTNRDRIRSVEEQEFTLALDVRRNYYGVLEQQRLLDQAIELLADRRFDLEVTQLLARVGQSDALDKLNAEVTISEQEIAVEEQRDALEQSIIVLRNTLGNPDLPPFRLADVEVEVFDPAAIDPEDLIEQALQTSPTIQDARSSLRNAELSLRGQKFNYWPQVSFNFGVSVSSQIRDEWGVDFDYGEYQSNMGVSVSIPNIASGNPLLNRDQVVRQEIALDNQVEAFRNSRLQIEQQVRSAYQSLKSQYRTLQLREQQIALAETSLDATRGQYRLGAVDYQQLQTSITQAENARRQLITAQFQFATQRMALEELLGVRVGPDGIGGEADDDGDDGSEPGMPTLGDPFRTGSGGSFDTTDSGRGGS